MPEPTIFHIRMHSGTRTEHGFEVHFDADEMRGITVPTLCTLDQLDDKIASAVAQYRGVRHSAKDLPDGPTDPANDIVTVDIDVRGRKPRGFNAWDAKRTKRFPYPTNAAVTA